MGAGALVDVCQFGKNTIGVIGDVGDIVHEDGDEMFPFTTLWQCTQVLV